MIRYSLLFFVIILIGCKNTPRDAAKDYCNCLQSRFHQIKHKTLSDTTHTFVVCDSVVAMHYDELYTIYKEKNPSVTKKDSAIKFLMEFVDLRLEFCCSYIGNCDTINISFLDSIRNAYSSYIINENVKPIDLISHLSIIYKNQYFEHQHKYEIQEHIQLVSLDENGTNNSSFYYENVDFKNSKDLDSLIYLLEDNNYNAKISKTIGCFKRINQNSILLCYYDKFDFDKMKGIINNSFQGTPIINLLDSR
jgi:hypothetical protein